MLKEDAQFCSAHLLTRSLRFMLLRRNVNNAIARPKQRSENVAQSISSNLKKPLEFMRRTFTIFRMLTEVPLMSV